MIVVTTPTGDIGGQVLAGLLDRGAPVRVIARDPSRVPDGVDVVAGSHGNPDVVAKAFAGADAVFWLAPPNFAATNVVESYVDFSRAAATLAAHGGQRVVAVSALGRGTPMAARAGMVSASLAMDALFADAGVAYRSLALPSFMDNVKRQVVPIREHGVYREPFPATHSAPTVATRDVAATAVGLLLDSSWNGVGDVPLLGPADVTFEERAEVLSEVLGKPVRFERTPDDAHRAVLVSRGASPAVADAIMDMVRAKREGGLDFGVTRTPASATPTTFRQWCEEVLRPLVSP
ncbi:NmrA family transcriptional regulator [Virgisporangium aliadipatigenens]|uniref:NmrA family transcriptional regulator n=1 Tax=Virgisporangium aliadipatigenens TaxID=741659 RepID=A0A8J4DPK2_9ACTN|nr:NAD(P)H-binding protein [Virgisporangium aliadipatigenens]GIJ46030.1 NmrA family transcriptional regulator [Virgisporangium aliadipatigenens]